MGPVRGRFVNRIFFSVRKKISLLDLLPAPLFFVSLIRFVKHCIQRCLILFDQCDKQVILWLGADYFVIPNQLDLKAKLFVRSGKHSNMGGDASGLYFGAEFFF